MCLHRRHPHRFRSRLSHRLNAFIDERGLTAEPVSLHEQGIGKYIDVLKFQQVPYITVIEFSSQQTNIHMQPGPVRLCQWFFPIDGVKLALILYMLDFLHNAIEGMFLEQAKHQKVVIFFGFRNFLNKILSHTQIVVFYAKHMIACIVCRLSAPGQIGIAEPAKGNMLDKLIYTIVVGNDVLLMSLLVP